MLNQNLVCHPSVVGKLALAIVTFIAYIQNHNQVKQPLSLCPLAQWDQTQL